MSGMIAVTLGFGPKYWKAAHIAAETVKTHTGLSTIILGGPERQYALEPYEKKLALFDYVEADTILYFDADTRFCCDWDVRRYENTESVIGVGIRHHRNDVQRICKANEIDPFLYINTGMFIASRQHHKDVFDHAKTLPMPKAPHYEQTPLNIAMQRLHVPVTLLSRLYNWTRPNKTTWQFPVVVLHMIGGNRFGTVVRSHPAKYRTSPKPPPESLRELTFYPDGRTNDPAIPYYFYGVRETDEREVLVLLNYDTIVEEILL